MRSELLQRANKLSRKGGGSARKVRRGKRNAITNIALHFTPPSLLSLVCIRRPIPMHIASERLLCIFVHDARLSRCHNTISHLRDSNPTSDDDPNAHGCRAPRANGPHLGSNAPALQTAIMRDVTNGHMRTADCRVHNQVFM